MLVFALYGLDDALPLFASYFLSGEFGHRDGMPMFFLRSSISIPSKPEAFLLRLSEERPKLPASLPHPLPTEVNFGPCFWWGILAQCQNHPSTLQ